MTTMNRFPMLAAVVLALGATPASGQESELVAPCARSDVPQQAREYCAIVAQALESAQPQVGILIAGGNPTLGSASAGGLRLGTLPGVSAGLSANLVFIRVPNIVADQGARIDDAAGIPAPALSGSVSIGVFPGFSALPTVGGIGSVDLLGSAVWLPLSAAGGEGFEDGTADLAYGAGVRVGILRESFVTPGISVSVMHRRMSAIRFGDVCPALSATGGTSEDGYTFSSGSCASEGDAGEFRADLEDWSTRAMIGKRLLGLGLAAGVGYDRFSSDVGYGFRAPEGTLPGTANYFARASDLDLANSRWSAFVNGSLTLLVTSVALEAGWLQGGEALEGFPSTSDFEPARGTFFGSVGVRLAL